MNTSGQLEILLQEAKNHIQAEYRGIFSARQMDDHYRNYIEADLSRAQLDLLRALAPLKAGQKILDLGCGFGTFALACAQAGLEATGLDAAEYQISFARRRAGMAISGGNPPLYILGDAGNTGLAGESFDVATAWNLLEHVTDLRIVIEEAYRLLKPGGFFLGIAPNYATVRAEAHYGVLWIPLMTRTMFASYLRLRGRNPEYFRTSIFPLSNWEVLRAMEAVGFHLLDPDAVKIHHPELIQSPRLRGIVQIISNKWLSAICNRLLWFRQWNPFKSAIFFCGQRP